MPTRHYLQRPTIRLASSASELDQLYAFRYRIYVEEMHRKQKYADHVHARIRDPLDDQGKNLIAWDSKDEVVGTVRTNFSRDGDLSGYDEFYSMVSAGEAHPKSTSICTRLMTSPEHRLTPLAIRLSVAVYELGLAEGITHNFIDCNAHLVSFFTRLGFVRHISEKLHYEYGEVQPMRLTLRDRAHLDSVSSPFVSPLSRWENETRHMTTASGECVQFP